MKLSSLRVSPRLFLAVSCFGILLSCASAPAPQTAGQSDLQSVAKELRDLKLKPGELWVREIGKSDEAWDVSPQAAAGVMLALDEWFDFQEKMEPSEIDAMSEALFRGLPKLAAPGDCRVVAVGGIFRGDSPLIVIIDQFKLKDGIVPGQTFGLEYVTNSARFRAEDKQTKTVSNVGTGTFIDSKSNYVRDVLPRSGGRLVLASNLNLGKFTVDTAANSMDRANLMDTFIKDEDESNDPQVEALYHAVRSDSAADPMVRFTAEVNWGLYLFHQGRIDEAAAHWASVSASLPPDADPSARDVLARDIPLLLGIRDSWK